MKGTIKSISKMFNDYETEFINTQIPKQEVDVLNKINQILNVLDLGDQNINNDEMNGFDSWSGDKLVSAEEKISRYSEMLGDWITFHESRSDFAYIWRKGQYAKDWIPMKNELNNKLKNKVTNPEVDNALTEKYIGEQFFSMFHRRRADSLIRKIEAIDRMLRTIAHRLRELQRQQNLN